MSPDVYGDLSYHIDAKIWAKSFLTTSIIYLIGLHQNGRMPLLSPMLRMFSNVVLFVLHAYLGVSAFVGMVSDPEFKGSVVFAYSIFMLCMIHGCFFVQNMLDYKRRMRHG